jgi:hypothetical protein
VNIKGARPTHLQLLLGGFSRQGAGGFGRQAGPVRNVRLQASRSPTGGSDLKGARL